MPDVRIQLNKEITALVNKCIAYCPSDKGIVKQYRELNRDVQSLTKLLKEADREEADADGWPRG